TCWTLNNRTYDGPAFSLSPQNLQLMIPVTPATIQDGTTNTVIFSEMIKGTNTTSDGPGMVYVANTTQYTNSGSSATDKPALLPAGLLATVQAIAADCQASKTKGVFTTKGYSWMYHNCMVGGGYSHIMPPNGRTCS